MTDVAVLLQYLCHCMLMACTMMTTLIDPVAP